MRLRRKHSPTMTFPKGVDTAEELMATLATDHGRRALETKLRVDAKMRKYR
jgi:hypothetical protein